MTNTTEQERSEKTLSRLGVYANSLGLKTTDAYRILSWIEVHAPELIRQRDSGQGEAVPSGMKLVPIEPTAEMVKVGVSYFKDNCADIFKSSEHYIAMLSVSPNIGKSLDVSERELFEDYINNQRHDAHLDLPSKEMWDTWQARASLITDTQEKG